MDAASTPPEDDEPLEVPMVFIIILRHILFTFFLTLLSRFLSDYSQWFLAKDFNLTRKPTFDRIRSLFPNAKESEDSIKYEQIEPTVRMLEDFTDIIEVEILLALNKHREFYMSAMDTFSHLEVEIDSTIGSIKMFRGTLGQADNSLVQGGIDIVKIHQSKERRNLVLDLVCSV